MQFGLLQQYLAQRFGDGTVPPAADFIVMPWAESYWRPKIDKGSVAATLKSIFSGMPGVIVSPPPEKQT